MAHEHGAVELLKDIQKLGCHEVILNRDGELALHNLQQEVKKRREGLTFLENSGVAKSQANVAAERAVHSLGELVRVLREGLENRLGIKLNGAHLAVAWMVELPADTLSKYEVGVDGRTGYERMKSNGVGSPITSTPEAAEGTRRSSKGNGGRDVSWGTIGGEVRR